MKTPILMLLICLFLFQISFSQNPNIPADYKLEKIEDYPPYKNQVLEAIIWLENNPISDENENVRKPAQKFVMVWLMGNADVHPPLIQSLIQPVMDENEKYAAILMGRFLFGEAKALMENPEGLSDIDLYSKGLESMVKAYESISPKIKLKSMEKYKKMIKDGKLQKWLGDKM